MLMRVIVGWCHISTLWNHKNKTKIEELDRTSSKDHVENNVKINNSDMNADAEVVSEKISA